MQELWSEMTDEILPIPVTQWRDKESGQMAKTEDATIMELFAKIVEETAEAMRDEARMETSVADHDRASAERYRWAMGMELTDVITAATTMLEKMGFDKYDRINLIRAVNDKNRARGYHE